MSVASIKSLRHTEMQRYTAERIISAVKTSILLKESFNMYPTDAELTFWIVALVLALVFMFIVLPLWGRYQEKKEHDRMFSHYRYTEYHDDMEDWQ